MKKKLTLTVEESVIEMAKAYAESQQQSLSALFENMMQVAASPFRKKQKGKEKSEIPEDIHPDALKLFGIFKTDGKDYDYKKVLEQELLNKYGRA